MRCTHDDGYGNDGNDDGGDKMVMKMMMVKDDEDDKDNDGDEDGDEDNDGDDGYCMMMKIMMIMIVTDHGCCNCKFGARTLAYTALISKRQLKST